MQDKKSNRIRQKIKQGRCKLSTLKREITKAKNTKTGIKKIQILNFLKCAPNFIGCYSENELSDISINSFPSYFIVNIDRSYMQGSHWISIGIFRDKIEIFDSLGFKLFNLSRIPCDLLNFLHKFSQSRKIITLKQIQGDNSTLCGYYSIFYCVCRPFYSFRYLEKLFSSKFSVNDSALIKFFS